jgi:hypothetical protein
VSDTGICDNDYVKTKFIGLLTSKGYDKKYLSENNYIVS